MAALEGVQLREDVQYRVLGPLTVMVEGRPLKLGGPRQRTVLAVLLSRANRTVSQDSLIDRVWSSEPPEAAKATLQGYVYGLRRELGGDVIVRHGDGYRVETDADHLDSLKFEQLLTRARTRVVEEPEAVFDDLTEALGLWHGTPYAGLEGTAALVPEIVRLEELRLDAIELRLDAKLALGEHGSATAELETLVREHPLRERFRAQQMLALYRAGRQADALRAFQEARHRLGEELGIEPSPELRDLEQRILEQDPALEVAGRAASGAVDLIDVVRGFELRETIGTGAFGIVRRAYQPSVGREVAIKIIRPEFANDPSFVRRFEREARIVANLEHPHIVPLFDFWRDPSGAFLVMPYLRGASLAHSLRTGSWNLEPAVRLIQQVGSALAYAHRHGVLHRDIKAANVLLDEEGNAYLTDFGIATASWWGSSPDISTRFPAPEVQTGGDHTALSDQFSLAVLSYQVLTGVVPTAGSFPSIIDARPGLGSDFADVLSRAMAEEPSERYSSIEAYMRAVRLSLGVDISPTAAPDEPSRSPASIRNPYKGLRAFRQGDAADFHGRDAAISDILEALSAHDLVTVVGPSGSGKSSLLRAGVLPALQAGAIPGSRHWLVAEMYPGERPLEELETALLGVAVDRPSDILGELRTPGGLTRILKRILPDTSATLLLVVDQLEELFSPAVGESDRQALIEALTETIDDGDARFKVVATLRADFLDRPLTHPLMRDAMAGGIALLAPPSRDGLTQAIAVPARAVGLDIEPGLVGRILADVEHQPGALPLLQFALTELVAVRESDALTVADYERTGGVVGALSRRAEEIFEGLPTGHRAVARQVLMRMVTVDEGVADTRLRLRLGELRSLNIDQDALGEVLTRFSTYRLLTFDRDALTRSPTVEIAHEALLTEWPRMASWLDEQRESLINARRLRSAANEWDESGRESGFLLRGARLAQAEAVATGPIAISAIEAELITASRDQRAAEARHERSRRRRLVALLTALLVGVSGVAVFAAIQRSDAIQVAHDTYRRGVLTFATEFAESDPQLALLLALEAAQDSLEAGVPIPNDTIGVLNLAVRSNRAVLRPGQSARAIDAASDGSLLALAHGPAVDIVDVSDGSLVSTTAGTRLISEISLSPDGSRLAVAYTSLPLSDPYLINIVDVATGRIAASLEGLDHSLNLDLAWNQTGTRLAALSWTLESAVSMFDVETGERVGTAEVGKARDLAFIDADSVVLADPSQEAVLTWTVGSDPEEVPTPGTAARAIAADAESGTVAITTADPLRLEMWDLRAGEAKWSVFLPPLTVDQGGWAVALDGRTGTVFVPHAAGGIELYSAESGAELLSIPAPGNLVKTLATAGDERLATLTGSGIVTIWDVSRGGPDAVSIVSRAPCGIRISPDGREAVSTGVEGILVVADLAAGSPTLVLPDQNIGHEHQATVSGDWQVMAWTNEQCETWVRGSWDGTPVVRMPDCMAAKAFNRDGSLLLLSPFVESCPRKCAGVTTHISVVESGSAREVMALDGSDVWGKAAVFVGALEPRTGEVLIANIDSTLQLYEVPSGRLLRSIEDQGGWITLAVDPGERYLAASNSEREVVVFDLPKLLAGGAPDEAIVARFELLAEAWGLAVSGDGRLAVSGDHNLSVWDIRSKQLIASPEVGISTPPFADFAPDGDSVWYADSGGVLRRYYLDEKAVLERARRLVIRNLTLTECERYLGHPCDPDTGGA